MVMPFSILFVSAAVVLHGISGVPGLWLRRTSPVGQRIATGLSVCAAVLGLIGACLGLAHPITAPIALSWRVLGEPLTLGLDALSAFFLIPLFLMGGLGSIYGLRYWAQEEHPENGRALRLFWGLTVTGIALLLIARHAALFLLGWELMAISAFFMISTEDHLPDVRQSGWIYLVATHTGTLALFAFFALYRHITGSFELRAIGIHEAGLAPLTALFLLALTGFGLKAGMMPLHFWLPGAHANAPSHVSALMSGVLIKMGIYGLVRFVGYLPAPPISWGVLILIAGCVSGVLGVAFAIGQHDLKRLLAYHSVENIGIILMGYGLAMIGRNLNNPLWIALGLGGCLLHVWNHGLFKALLFLSAGSVIHATGTRTIDRMGGAAKTMPWSAALFLIGAVAICGLPPLNGFASEWLIYLGLLHTVHPQTTAWPAASLAIPVLALIGALALACFVKVYGAVFLGNARDEKCCAGHEAPWAMRAPMVVLALACFIIGLFPFAVAPALNQAIAAWSPAPFPPLPDLRHYAPLPILTITGLFLLIFCGALTHRLVRSLRRIAPQTPAETWGCGYSKPTARIQYTASSFVQFLLRLFRGIMRPHEHRPDMRPLFMPPSSFSTHVDEPVLDRQLLPACSRIAEWFVRLHPIQKGYTNLYLMYVLFAVIALLIWTMPVGHLFEQLFTR